MAEIDIEHLPFTRKEALETGSKHFFTGEACGKGHISPRLASNGICTGCTRAWYAANAEKSIAAAKAWQAANPERLKETNRAYRQANSDKIRENNHAWLAENQERNRETQRAYRAAHRDKYREHNRSWTKNNPDKVRESIRACQAAKPEKYREMKAAYRASHPEMMRKCRKAWKQANPGKIAELDRNRRARKRNAEGNHTAADVARIRQAQKDHCAMPDCRSKLNGEGHVDHIIALSKGGSNWPRNLQLLCEPCNLSKSARDPIEFAQSRGMLI
jgi:5-methylcytosine-specific restriction endonuclease McrA